MYRATPDLYCYLDSTVVRNKALLNSQRLISARCTTTSKTSMIEARLRMVEGTALSEGSNRAQLRLRRGAFPRGTQCCSRVSSRQWTHAAQLRGACSTERRLAA